MNFNAPKIILKINKKLKTDPGLILTQGNLLVASTYVQDMRKSLQ